MEIALSLEVVFGFSQHELPGVVSMFRLSDLASDNETSIESAFDSAVRTLSPEGADLLNRFASWIETETFIAVNTRLYVVTNILSGSRYLNTYEWAEEQSALSGRDVDEILREQLRDFYSKRIAFEKEFEDGRRFRYGALNAGGMGLATKYSNYCVILKRDFQSSLREVAVLPGDSLLICFQDDGNFDVESLKRNVCPFAKRPQLVASERVNEVVNGDIDDWPKLVVSDSKYFEVIFLGDIDASSIECVRISRREYFAKWDLAFMNLGSHRSEAERAVVNDFIQLRKAELEGRVRVEVEP